MSDLEISKKPEEIVVHIKGQKVFGVWIRRHDLDRDGVWLNPKKFVIRTTMEVEK